MIAFLKSLLSNECTDEPATQDQAHIATAALLIEAALSDDDYQDVEREAIVDVLVRHYSISKDDARELVQEAEKAQAETEQLFYFTRTVKDSFPVETRVQMIEMLWEIAYADGVLSKFEANLVRRVAGLIYVNDRDRGDARKRVMARLGINEG
ncbi:TerB family tellurite resistance protein [Sneathiella litorea]|uniref:TerB family tellurite resistance protein n=1 Tax=Sneathiella litorea TaxID=2606216 RepID=A0A6L8W2B0_9PROT|nr:TerB family tellurite resistance protein [Sneathiella litorea]MZR29028.1 TerB family tellurite resistance protein [Sneathiella litorea]